jgi:hypothetical protein
VTGVYYLVSATLVDAEKGHWSKERVVALALVEEWRSYYVDPGPGPTKEDGDVNRVIRPVVFLFDGYFDVVTDDYDPGFIGCYWPEELADPAVVEDIDKAAAAKQAAWDKAREELRIVGPPS